MLVTVDSGDKKRPEPAVAKRYPPGCEVSKRLKELATQDEDHWLRTFSQIAHEAGVKLADSAVYKIMHEHHNLYRYKSQHKPPLDAQGKLSQLRLAE